MKVCCRCKGKLPQEAFNKNKRSKDGLKPYCRKCQSIAGKNYYYSNKDKIQTYRDGRKEITKEYNHIYYQNNQEKLKEYYNNVYKENREEMIKKNLQYRKNNPLKYQAHNVIHLLRYKGFILKKGYCSICRKYAKLDAHHPDYNKPKFIKYICRSCHRRLHYMEKLNEQVG